MLTLADYQLMRAHGYSSYHPGRETPEQGAVRSALSQARALAELRAEPMAWVAWEDDPGPWHGGVPYDGPLFGATLYLGGQHVGSVWGVAVADTSDPYCRVLEAEMWEEFAWERERLREACLARGVE